MVVSIGIFMEGRFLGGGDYLKSLPADSLTKKFGSNTNIKTLSTATGAALGMVAGPVGAAIGAAAAQVVTTII